MLRSLPAPVEADFGISRRSLRPGSGPARAESGLAPGSTGHEDRRLLALPRTGPLLAPPSVPESDGSVRPASESVAHLLQSGNGVAAHALRAPFPLPSQRSLPAASRFRGRPRRTA